MHVLDTDGAAVGVTKNTQDLAQLHERAASKTADSEFAIKIPEG